MSSTYKLLLLPGDGIGVEVMKQTQNVINFIEEYSERICLAKNLMILIPF